MGFVRFVFGRERRGGFLRRELCFDFWVDSGWIRGNNRGGKGKRETWNFWNFLWNLGKNRRFHNKISQKSNNLQGWRDFSSSRKGQKSGKSIINISKISHLTDGAASRQEVFSGNSQAAPENPCSRGNSRKNFAGSAALVSVKWNILDEKNNTIPGSYRKKRAG